MTVVVARISDRDLCFLPENRIEQPVNQTNGLVVGLAFDQLVKDFGQYDVQMLLDVDH